MTAVTNPHPKYTHKYEIFKLRRSILLRYKNIRVAKNKLNADKLRKGDTWEKVLLKLKKEVKLLKQLQFKRKRYLNYLKQANERQRENARLRELRGE